MAIDQEKRKKRMSVVDIRKDRMAQRHNIHVAATEQASVRKRQLERGKEFLAKTRKRVEILIKMGLVIGGAAVFFLILIGMVLLERIESCRFPRHQLCETFTYEIDLEYPLEALPPAPKFQGGKIRGFLGGQVDTIELAQEYGTYHMVPDNSRTTNEIRFVVCNRAQDKYYLPRTTTMTAERVHVEKGLDMQWMTKINIDSLTSGKMTGETPCRRSDVTIHVPTQCLLESTKITTDVVKGNLFADNLTTTFEVVTMYNEVGRIHVNQMQANRINLNSSSGEIEATDVTAHFLFMQQRDNGGTIKGKDLKLFSADNTTACTTSYSYREGYPKTPEYEVRTTTCMQEEGKLTTNSKGEEGEIVRLDRVKGGNIEHQNKVGVTKLELVACMDFSGDFRIRSDDITIQMGITPEQEMAAKNTLAGVAGFRASMKQYFTVDPVLSSAREYIGTICTENSGIEDMPYGGDTAGNHTLDMWSIETGPIEITIWAPETDSGALALAAWAIITFLLPLLTTTRVLMDM
mmetsp:Transcript_11908/g.14174  ORF Transcript_11908/g.14174 Transcript_11908/m.14174 type:complete len:519 (-) Transcript_11908:915-2471(-)|eukprot:CAMPEP_0197865116 /NCGR_PEP_ID=MMETSP1438-20131217/43477_1 /TAXON_ID=1461541 /ORGANISM="Pterosperma sp., Strain CCMP1384" /LENGTH=518 /DNA_ID=CAMNT_0043483529 /DNA_START=236 /DNA_END=1792 /DNA_ORIENTATION=+